MFLAGDGSYQELLEESAGASSPLEHFWSLAIEEQFYWVWPMVIFGAFRVVRGRRGQIGFVGAITALLGGPLFLLLLRRQPLAGSGS